MSACSVIGPAVVFLTDYAAGPFFMKSIEYRVQIQNEMGDWSELDCTDNLDKVDEMLRQSIRHYPRNQLRVMKIVTIATPLKQYHGKK